MHTWDAIGYVAAILVLTAFGMKNIIPLRVAAICSNLVFIIYGLGLGLTPIWSLHAALLPMNAWRLVEALGDAQAAGANVLRRVAQKSLSAPSGNASYRPRDQSSPHARGPVVGVRKLIARQIGCGNDEKARA
jgi:hypothetical protein